MSKFYTTVSLKSLSIKQYRSLKHAHFEPNRHLSVLIGPNGSGKTNILHAIQLLRLSMSPRYREEKATPLATRCVLSAAFAIGRKTLGYRATVVLSPSDRNRDEVVTTNEAWNLAEFGGENSWTEIPRPIFDPRYRHYYKQLTFDGRKPTKKSIWPVSIEQSGMRALTATHLFKSSIKYYSASQFTDPSRCPSSFEIEEDDRVVETYSDRGPHLSFISGLYQIYKNARTLYESYMEIIGPMGIGLISSIEWKPIVLSTGTVDIKTGGKVVRRRKKRILIVPIVSLRRSKLSFNQLSEGTFRTLALLFYLVTDQTGLLLIEEPEVCVHHGLLRSIIETIKALSIRKQIIISTHSELVLDSVEPENVFSVSHQAVRGSTIRSLSNAMSHKEYAAMKSYLATAGNLGEYWTHGGIE